MLKMEKNQFVYHGSSTGGITELEPRQRYTPHGEDVGSRVYASPSPSFAAAQSFPWSSDDGVDILYENGTLVLVIPEEYKDWLNRKVFIYKLDAQDFTQTIEDQTGKTVHSNCPVTPQEIFEFNSVVDAIEYFGGRVKNIPKSE